MDQVLLQIKAIASRYPLQKIVLFGSRARGDHRETSDYDLAVFGDELTAGEKSQLALEIEDLHTLHKFDIVWINKQADPKLIANIAREGVVVYESFRQ